MIAPCDRWGPFAPDLPEPERIARCRALATAAQVFAGPAAAALVAALRRFEANENTAPEALAELDRLPSIPRRRALATFAQIHRPGGAA